MAAGNTKQQTARERRPQAPKIAPDLTTAERVALRSILKTEEEMYRSLAEIDQQKRQVIAEIEQRQRLEPGAIGTTHMVNGDDWKIEVASQNGATPD